jgi:hypothetical protein
MAYMLAPYPSLVSLAVLPRVLFPRFAAPKRLLCE